MYVTSHQNPNNILHRSRKNNLGSTKDIDWPKQSWAKWEMLDFKLYLPSNYTIEHSSRSSMVLAQKKTSRNWNRIEFPGINPWRSWHLILEKGDKSINWKDNLFIYNFYLLLGLGFEFRASALQSRYPTAWATPSVYFPLVILEMGFLELSSPSHLPK
jgi:hypothetical protein